MTLYYIHAEVATGDADGPTNMDLFMHAETVSRAVVLWRDYFDGWDMPDKCTVYEVSGPAMKDSVITWEALPKWEIEFEGDGPVVCDGCGAVNGAPEWGTVGDGFDGYCAGCADEREQEKG